MRSAASPKPITPALQLSNANMRAITQRRERGSQSYEKPLLTDLRDKILVFDTETTGFLSTRIVQIAYCKYYKSGVNYSQHSNYVRQLTDAELTSIIRREKPDIVNYERELGKARYSEKEAQEIHKIPLEIINDPALPTIRTVLEHFNNALNDIKLIVGHNVLYDLRIVYLEAQRINYRELMYKLRTIPYLDTMKISKSIVKATTKDGKQKMPNLGELYRFLFPDEPDVLGFHNAIVDVDVTARCYFRLMNRDVFNNSKIRANPIKYAPVPAVPKPVARKMAPAPVPVPKAEEVVKPA